VRAERGARLGDRYELTELVAVGGMGEVWKAEDVLLGREVAVKVLLFGIAGSFTAGLANLADVLWPLWDDENRALHDFVVDTRTVKE